MEPGSVLGEFLGGRQGCSAHEWSRMAAVINKSEEVLGEFFRIAPLRELVGRRPAHEPGLRDKICAIVGIAMGLDPSGMPPSRSGFGLSSGWGGAQRFRERYPGSIGMPWHKACYHIYTNFAPGGARACSEED